MIRKVLFTATVDSHILHFHLPYLKWFKEQGYETHVATNTDIKIPFCDVKHKISFERSPYNLKNITAIKDLKKIIDNENYSLIHTHTPMGSVVTRLAAISSRKRGTQVIYTAHGFHFYEGSSLFKWLAFYPVEKFLSNFTDCIITINKEDYDLAKAKFRTKKIEYIAGVGVASSKFDFESNNEELEMIKKNLGCSKDSFILIFPAELSKRKNQTMLIDSMSKLVKLNNRIHLLLPGSDSMNGYHKNYVSKLDIDDNIHFLGYRTDIPKLIKLSDVVVSSAKQEGLPINIIEAMMAKKAVIATNCRGNRDLVKDEISGYIVKTDDVDEFSDSVIRLINDRELLNDMASNSHKLSKEYELSKILKEYERVYMEVLDKDGK